MGKQDLRTGNIVLHNASGTTVTIIKVENSKVLLDTFPENSYWPNTDVSGIPLTTSMLEKLTFNNDEQYDKWCGEGISIDMKDDGFFYGLRITKSRAKIQYLHQLQNYIADFYSLFRQQKHSLDISALYSNSAVKI
ncbi:MAG: hypothetical protein JO072_09665 [Parafilimonas sp.]|nr:hypothetical protein [Parafilimonas sp.]